MEEYLRAHPMSLGRDIVAAGAADPEGPFSRPSVLRHLRVLFLHRIAHRSRGRYWIGEIGDPELALAADIEWTLAVFRAATFTGSAKLAAATWLSRESSQGRPISRHVIELIRLAPKLRRPIRRALLPFVQRAVRAAFEPFKRLDVKQPQGPPGKPDAGKPSSAPVDIGYTRRLWSAARSCVNEWLEDRGDDGTLAWNTVYEIVRSMGVIGDAELYEYAKLAMSVEARGGLPAPSAARAVFRELSVHSRFRDSIRSDLLRRISHTKGGEHRNRLAGLLNEVGPAQAKTQAEDRTPQHPSSVS